MTYSESRLRRRIKEFSSPKSKFKILLKTQGPEGEDEKQVKVATVRKDVWDLKENFPLHITVGPKVAKSLTYTITICPRSISIKRFRQQNHPFEFLCLYLFNILP